MVNNRSFPEMVSTNLLLEMFPFHLLLNSCGKIAEIGPSLLKACPDLKPGVDVQMFFECQAPTNGFSPEIANKPNNTLYIIRHIESKMTYRGSRVFLDSCLHPFLILKPWISQPEELKHLNLTINDFPSHDQTLDIIQLLQTHRIAISDLNMLNDALLLEHKILKEQRDELDWIYKNAPIGLAVFDINGIFLHVNEYLANVHDLAVEAHIGQRIRNILPLMSARFDRAKEEIALSKAPVVDQEIEICFPSAPETTRYFNESWYPVVNKENDIVGFGVLVEEKTDKRSAEALREVDERKNRFLAALSHELRNPVATIGMSIDIIKEKFNEKAFKDLDISPFIDRAERQLKHLRRLLDDLLEVSRISQGKIELRLSKVDIRDVLRGSIDLSIQKVQSAHHQLTVDWPRAAVYVKGDPERLTQIFANLIDNAAKYTDANGKIQISIITGSDFVEVTITDNGVGIKQENISNIFEMFYQIKSAHEKRGLGLGIGLALVQQLVSLHSGSINVTSEGEGKGTAFAVRLPKIE